MIEIIQFVLVELIPKALFMLVVVSPVDSVVFDSICSITTIFLIISIVSIVSIAVIGSVCHVD